MEAPPLLLRSLQSLTLKKALAKQPLIKVFLSALCQSVLRNMHYLRKYILGIHTTTEPDL